MKQQLQKKPLTNTCTGSEQITTENVNFKHGIPCRMDISYYINIILLQQPNDINPWKF
jgi:hypothetical protein